MIPELCHGRQPVSAVERFIVIPFYGGLFLLSRLVVVGPLMYLALNSSPIVAGGVGVVAVIFTIISEVCSFPVAPRGVYYIAGTFPVILPSFPNDLTS
jgi:Na+/H+ antiporter NhaB